jgi:acyl-CoA synthetase (AMP-forming)/AMP-acid ligase II
VGQIAVAGPNVMDGYWHAPEQAAERFRGELRTGDFGWLDETGRLYFAGRRDELFKRNGVRTSSQEIEAALLDIPGVEEAAVALDADGRLLAWVVADRTEYDVRVGVAHRLGFAKSPDRCTVLPELPRTRNGKVDKAMLLHTARSGAR